jgi:D-arabinitol 4-dehydrogenase
MNTLLHLGVGAFHRAHLAEYFQRLQQIGEAEWRLIGANIRNDDAAVMQALIASRGAYTLQTVAPDGTSAFERMHAIDRIVPWSADHGELIRIAAEPSTRIISFTVTEAGYYLQDNTLLEQSDGLRAELRDFAQSRPLNTIYGVLALALRTRKMNEAGPITLLCCDNLRSNGERVRAGLLRFIELTGERELYSWVRENTTSPNCMVDRITPRPDACVREQVKAATGIDDPAAVMSESYIQWVIEDDFIAGRPRWEMVGAQLVDSVAPHEEAKIRILNGSHSCLAWGGALADHEFIHEAVGDASLRAHIVGYVADVMPCLIAAHGMNAAKLQAYRDIILQRFSNGAVRDSVARVSQDSFSKFSGFISPTIGERLAVRADIGGVAVLPALLLKFWERWRRGDLPFRYDDSRDGHLAAEQICSAADPVAALCASSALFGAAAGSSELIRAVRAASSALT